MHMMFTFLIFVFASLASAFVPVRYRHASNANMERVTQLHSVDRREVVQTTIGGILGLVLAPQTSIAKGSTFFYDEKIENVREESQMPTNGKVDLNSAFVGEYKQFPGMFPHAAGMIASHGPYTSVNDIYKIKGLTDNDKKLFKKYDKEFTANPPGRSFGERINSRVST